MTTPNESTTQTPAADGMADAIPVWTPPPPETEPAIPLAGVDAPATAPEESRPGHARRASSVTALLVIGAILAACGIGFAAGRATSTGETGTGQTNGGPQNGNLNPGLPGANGGGAPGGFAGDGFGINVATTGTVVSVSSDSITIKLANGETTTIATAASTTYHEQNSTTGAAVTAGQTVSVKVNGLPGRPDDLNAGAGPEAGAGAPTATDVTITSR